MRPREPDFERNTVLCWPGSLLEGHVAEEGYWGSAWVENPSQQVLR